MATDYTFVQVKNAFQSISGLESLTEADEFFLIHALTRAAKNAYHESNLWTRFLVAGEERAVVVADSSPYVPYAEGVKDTIEEFIRIHKTDPFVQKSSHEYEFYVDSLGAHVLGKANSTDAVYVTYKKEFNPSYNQESTDIPAEFVDYMIYAALADFYMGDGQNEKCVQAKEYATMALDSELFRLEQRSNANTINKRFSNHINRQSR